MSQRAFDPAIDPVFDIPELDSVLEVAGFEHVGFVGPIDVPDTDGLWFGADATWAKQNMPKGGALYRILSPAGGATWCEVARFWDSISIRVRSETSRGVVETSKLWKRLPNGWVERAGGWTPSQHQTRCASENRTVQVTDGGLDEILSLHPRDDAVGESTLEHYLQLDAHLLDHETRCNSRAMALAALVTLPPFLLPPLLFLLRLDLVIANPMWAIPMTFLVPVGAALGAPVAFLRVQGWLAHVARHLNPAPPSALTPKSASSPGGANRQLRSGCGS